ncbi:thioredoxin family protein [Serpentinicella alkaliphila]|uniref:Thioredoxin-like protein n=1 Tax=Serpentinicella alkaliphila TaxID=1734049 RepID=A0A4R2TJ39_9FIRM|nr:thioredoxin family protein [Serpentinicella alkaliphila]QUH25327.1 thioredoxin family protein [Serpentinicella alkaliphila]TCQ02387.1 thioredoxin-like protein [Serpentinicella alkaliphila]
MNIKIFEVVCCKGGKLENILIRALEELQIKVDFEVINDIQSILNEGILSPPTLKINNKIYISGRLPSVEQVKEAILKAKEEI